MKHTKENSRKRFDFYEGGYIHTKDLSLKDAQEMLERYKRIFPDIDFYIIDASQRIMY